MALYDNSRLLSRPVKVHWAGWETDTYKLQHAGWEISAYERMDTQSMMLAIRHHQHSLRGITKYVPFDYYQGYHLSSRSDYLDETIIGLEHLGGHINVYHSGPLDFQPIDATPQWSPYKVTSLDDLAHFAPNPMRNASKVIALPEATVDQLLSTILDKQQEAKTAYFREQLAREGHPLPAHNFHAQILTFKDAA